MSTFVRIWNAFKSCATSFVLVPEKTLVNILEFVHLVNISVEFSAHETPLNDLSNVDTIDLLFVK